jgi:peptide/nickel transport system substrate-binding protein
MRSGKIDVMEGMSQTQAAQMKQSNPAILQISLPMVSALAVDPRNDLAPFNDINVRKAMQMAINLPEIAQDYYQGTTDPWPSSLMSNYMTGWGFPYSQWPQSLKDEYAFNVPQAKALLTAAGYPNGFSTDCVADNLADLSLLQIVQNELAAINIKMSITTIDDTSFTSVIKLGHKQDALSFGSSDFMGVTFDPEVAVTVYLPSWPINVERINDPTYNDFAAKAGTAQTTADFKQILANQCQYIAEQHYFISLLQPKVFDFCQPWLKGYSGQTNAMSGGFGGVLLINFYPARCWIDSSVKGSNK